MENAKITDYYKYSKSAKYLPHRSNESKSIDRDTFKDQQVSRDTKRKEIIIKVSTIKTKYSPKHYKGNLTLYNKRKGNSFFLFDIDNWITHTNNSFVNEESSNIVKFTSDKRQPNLKFTTSQFLTSFFKNQKVIPNRIRNKYFNRLRDLLIVQRQAINNRSSKLEFKNDNETRVFIKFSYKYHTFYLGWWINCNKCDTPVASVRAKNVSVCYNHMDKTHVIMKKRDITEGYIKGK